MCITAAISEGKAYKKAHVGYFRGQLLLVLGRYTEALQYRRASHLRAGSDTRSNAHVGDALKELAMKRVTRTTLP